MRRAPRFVDSHHQALPSAKNRSVSLLQGFTLLELLVVIAIISTLLSLAMIRISGVQTRAKEVALKQDLHVLRQAIEQYTVEKQVRPQSLEDLVSADCLGEIPVDPFTRQRDWRVDTAGPLSATEKHSPGIVDVHSAAKAVSTEGTTYSRW